MKKLIETFKFILRLAYKNIIYTKIRSLILFITFIILIFLSIIAFSTKSFLYDYFYHYHFNKYNSIDLYLTYDENSSVRFFSIHELMDNIDIEEDFNFVAPFFETTSLAEINNNFQYVKIMAANIESLRKVNSKLPSSISEINKNEVIITSSISKKYHINKNDYVKLYINKELTDYKVIEVIEDDGLFYGDTIYLNKDKSIFPGSIFNSIYNKVYFDIKDKHNIPIIKEKLDNISYYQELNLIVKETINYELIEQSVNTVSSILYLAYAFILFAVILVLQSTLSLIFEERKTLIGIIKILGGNDNLSFLAILTELLVYFIPATIFGYLLSNLIINYGLKYIGSTLKYNLPLKISILAILFILIGLIIITIYNFLKIFKTSHIKLSISDKIQYKENIYLNFILFCISIFTITIINYLRLSIELQALIKIVFSFLLIFTSTKLLLTILKYILNFKNNKNLFTLLSTKILSDNKIIKQVINILIISFIMIILLTGFRNYIHNNSNTVKDNIKIDYIITNIVNKMDLTFEELQNTNLFTSIDKVYLYNNVYIKEVNGVFKYNMSLNANKINNYFNIDINDNTKNLLNDKNTPYILLPIKYHYIYDLNINDKVTLSINKSYDNEEFFIAGFFDIGSSDFIITNLNVLNKYSNMKPNSILINLKDEIDNIPNNLMIKYSQNMYQIINFNLLINDLLKQITDITQYITYVIFIIIICFMFTIFNNSVLQFNSLKSTYSRLKVLGCSYNRLFLNVLAELTIIIILIIISILFIFPIINNNIKYLLLFFNSFQLIKIENNVIFIGCLLAILMYFTSYIFYFYQLKHLDYSNTIKKF